MAWDQNIWFGIAGLLLGVVFDGMVARRACVAAVIARVHFSLTETALRDLLRRVDGDAG